jgi:biopolymer transport protein ExbD
VAPKEIFINITQQGHYIVGGRRVELPELEQLLRQAVANNPVHQSVIVRADRRVAFDHVVQAIDTCKRAGVRKYMVNTAGARSLKG